VREHSHDADVQACCRAGIYMSAFLDRLLGVDEKNYRFDAVLYFYISWESYADTAVWFHNNLGRNCNDPARSD